MRPAGHQGNAQLTLDLVVNVARDADFSRLGEGLEAGRDVHPIAQDVAVLDDDVANVDADAEREAPVLRHRSLALGDDFLDRDGALDRIDRAREFDQRAIAHQLDNAAVVFVDQRLDRLFPERLQARDRACFVGLDQAAVADHIRGQNRRQLSLDARRHRFASTRATKIGSVSPH